MTGWKHIGESICMSKMEIRWGKVPINIKIEVELINFFKSKPIPFKQGAYHDFAAIALKEMHQLGVDKGDIFCLTFPWKTLRNALYSDVSLYIKKTINKSMNNDNVYIKFTKKNKNTLDIHKLERRVEDPEMTKKADELVYNVKDETPNLPKIEEKKDENTPKFNEPSV